MNNNNNNNNLSVITAPEAHIKETLFKLFYEIREEVQDQTITISNNEIKETVQTTSWLEIVNHIKEAVNAWISQTKDLKQERRSATIPGRKDDKKYEQLLKYYENYQRIYCKTVFQYKLQKDALENRIEELLDMEEEFEEMKDKLKYEDGKFLNNDRKDNEIWILRRENTNVKKLLNQWEAKYKASEETSRKKGEIIESLKDEINALTEKNSRNAKKVKEISKIDTINTNAIISNGNNTYSQQGEIATCIDTHLKVWNLKKINPSHISSFTHIQSDIPLKQQQQQHRRQDNKDTHLKKQKTNKHQRNNSMSMWLDQKKIDLMNKYFSSFKKKGSCVRIKRIPLNISQSYLTKNK